MKRLYATIAILLLSGGLALAQGVGGAIGRGNQNTSLAPRAAVGVLRDDLTNRSNPQNMTLPGASNPQDLIR